MCPATSCTWAIVHASCGGYLIVTSIWSYPRGTEREARIRIARCAPVHEDKHRGLWLLRPIDRSRTPRPENASQRRKAVHRLQRRAPPRGRQERNRNGQRHCTEHDQHQGSPIGAPSKLAQGSRGPGAQGNHVNAASTYPALSGARGTPGGSGRSRRGDLRQPARARGRAPARSWQGRREPEVRDALGQHVDNAT